MHKKFGFFIIIIGMLLFSGCVKLGEIDLEESNINTFDECVAAGYPVMESYPRQCRTDSGSLFTEEMAIPQQVAILENWVRSSSPTFTFDGNNLILQEYNPLPCTSCYEAVFSFVSSHPGYGDRSGQTLTDDPTTHVIRVEIVTSQIISAITDGRYDEFNDKEIISPEGMKIAVEIYFPNQIKDPQMLDCSQVYSVTRKVDDTVDAPKAALEQLLFGLSEEEETAGYFTNLTADIEIISLSVEDGVARVEFSENFNELAGGACKGASIYAQIKQTLTQFSSIDKIEISAGGLGNDEVLQP